MSINKIQYKGYEIIVTDYSDCRNKEEMIETLLRSVKYIRSTPKMDLLHLTDMRGAHGSIEFMNEVKRWNKDLFTKKLAKSAIIGIDGLKSILLRAYNTVPSVTIPTVPFNSKEEALEYLSQKS